jgi:3-oxoacyl-[acyl-carrier protein] reductase
MHEDLRDRVVLVTGSSRGIGAAVAAAFAEVGARVVVHGRDEVALTAARRRIESAGGRALIVTGDVTRAAELDRMRERITAEWGPVDVLVANAGGSTSRPMPIEDIDEDDWRADLDRNLTATFLTVKCFLPDMKQRGSGAIITVSSAAGRRASAHTLVAYGAAKAGVQILTQDLAAQVGPAGIRVNCVAPETILTEANEAWIPADQREQLVRAHPVPLLDSFTSGTGRRGRGPFAVSSDGLLMAMSAIKDRANAERLAAVVSGLTSLAGGASTWYALGPLNRVIIDLAEGYLLVASISSGSVLGVIADRSANLSTSRTR